MTPARVGLSVLGIGLLSTSVLIGHAQAPVAPPAHNAPNAPNAQNANAPVFRVGVDVVRIDAVVTDKDGRVVPNLTANDFELRQDGDLIPLTLAQFVPVVTSSENGPAQAALSQTHASGTEAPPRQTPAGVQSKPAPTARADVQRSIAFVVDDLSLSFESFEPTRKALHKYIDTDIQPGDLVALVRTSSPGGTLKPFTTDRRLLHAQVDAMRWTLNSRNGIEPFVPLRSKLVLGGMGAYGSSGDPEDFSKVENLRNQMSAAGTLGALNLLVRSARELPGRRALVLLSEGFEIMGYDLGTWQPIPRVRGALDRLIEQATRAGVVIYTVDSRGLQSGGLQAADNAAGRNGAEIASAGGDRLKKLIDTQEGMGYLAEQTGGIAVANTNDLATGLRRATDDVRSYYIIGFTPAPGSFAAPGKTPREHKISLKVKRPGLKVRTRKSFFGVSDPDVVPGPITPAEALREAVMSPFATTEIPLKGTALAAFSPTTGTFVRALLHLDARALTFAPDAEGHRVAEVDVLGMAFDQEGIEVGHLSTGFSLALTEHAAQAALEDGVVYVLRVPIPHPGAYQVRFAVRDRRSAALGSVGEFVQIDDVAKGDFALSGIVIGENNAANVRPAEGLDAAGLLRQQARRIFAPGTNLTFAYEVYNASAPVQASITVWQGERKITDGPTDTLTPPGEAGQRFAAAGGIKLGEKLASGDYFLQVVARTSDSERKGKQRSATQRVEFEVR